MKGTHECLEAMAEVHLLFTATDTELEVVWWSRTEDLEMHASALSRYEEHSQREFNSFSTVYPMIYSQIIGYTVEEVGHKLILSQPELRGRQPICDLFTDEHTTKMFGGFTRVSGTRLQ